MPQSDSHSAGGLVEGQPLDVAQHQQRLDSRLEHVRHNLIGKL